VVLILFAFIVLLVKLSQFRYDEVLEVDILPLESINNTLKLLVVGFFIFDQFIFIYQDEFPRDIFCPGSLAALKFPQVVFFDKNVLQLVIPVPFIFIVVRLLQLVSPATKFPHFIGVVFVDVEILLFESIIKIL
jgi:hypothetical protein